MFPYQNVILSSHTFLCIVHNMPQRKFRKSFCLYHSYCTCIGICQANCEIGCMWCVVFVYQLIGFVCVYVGG